MNPGKLQIIFAEKNMEILRLEARKDGITKEQVLKEWEKIRHPK